MISTVLSFLAKSIAALSDLVPGWLWAAIFAGALAHGCVLEHERDGLRTELDTLRADVAAQEAVRSEIARLAEAGRRAAETRYQAEVAASRERTDREVSDLRQRVAGLLGQLQQRPERPAAGGGAVPAGGGGGLACTGAKLYRQDGAFLVGEAARADSLRIQLADCRRRHDSAVRLTNPQQALADALGNLQTTPTPKGTDR